MKFRILIAIIATSILTACPSVTVSGAYDPKSGPSAGITFGASEPAPAPAVTKKKAPRAKKLPPTKGLAK